jgi:hypothetical protein
MKGIRRYGLVGALSGLGMAAAFYAGVALAADARLDDADNNVEKAIALLAAAENPERKPPFGGHRAKAVALLKQARKEIEKAKKFADQPAKPDKPWGGKHDKDKNKKK